MVAKPHRRRRTERRHPSHGRRFCLAWARDRPRRPECALRAGSQRMCPLRPPCPVAQRSWASQQCSRSQIGAWCSAQAPSPLRVLFCPGLRDSIAGTGMCLGTDSGAY